jgi:hypothetical protein
MKRFLTGLLLASFALSALADAPDDYQNHMQLLPQHEGGQHRLVLPTEVYLHAEQPTLADLRLFNGSHESLPFAFSSEPAEPIPKPAQQTLNWFALSDADTRSEDVYLSVRLQPDGTLTASRNQPPTNSALTKRYLIDASQLKQPAQALEINAEDMQGALHHLTVEGSNDLKNWHTLADHAPWLDMHSDSGQLALKRIEFPPAYSKYLRLIWNDSPAFIKQVIVETAAENTPKQYLKHVLNVAQRQAASSDYEFALPPAICLEQLRLILPQPDSIATVSLFSRRAEHDSWSPVSPATFYRINRDNTEIVSPAHALRGFRARYWRIHLDRYSSALPASLQLEIGWRPHQVVFLASGSGPYTLAFGNAKAKSASYPLSTLLPGYHAGDELRLPLATTGAFAGLPAKEPSFAGKFLELEWRPLILWVILIAGVTLLGWMAWNIRKEFDQR